MRFRRLALASLALAFLVLGAWWLHERERQGRAWELVKRAFSFHRQWIPIGSVKWGIISPKGQWEEVIGSVDVTDGHLTIAVGDRKLACALSGCTIARPDMDLQTIPLEFSRAPNVPDRLTLLRHNYRIALEGFSSAAGRFCRVVRLTPRDRDGYERRLAIDPETGMVLRYEVIGLNGQVLKRVEWMTVTGRRKVSFTLPDRRGSPMVSHGRECWEALPEGFIIEGEAESECQCCPCGMQTRVIRGTDGLAEVVVYFLKDHRRHRCPYCRLPKEPFRCSQVGTVCLVFVRSPRPFVVAADLPPRVVMEIAQRLRETLNSP